MKMTNIMLTIAAAWLTTATASAQVNPPAPINPPAHQQRISGGPCKADVEQFCKDLKGPDIGKCLKAHEAELSQPCQKWQVELAKRRQTRVNFADACKGDLDRLCKDVPAVKGGKIKCLREHQNELSDACKTAMPKGRKDPKAAPQAAPQQP